MLREEKKTSPRKVAKDDAQYDKGKDQADVVHADAVGDALRKTSLDGSDRRLLPMLCVIAHRHFLTSRCASSRLRHAESQYRLLVGIGADLASDATFRHDQHAVGKADQLGHF